MRIPGDVPGAIIPLLPNVVACISMVPIPLSDAPAWLINEINPLKVLVPELVFRIVPLLTILPLLNQVEVVLLPLMFQIPLLVIVGVFENAIIPACQSKVPFIVRLASRFLLNDADKVSVLPELMVVTRAKKPLFQVKFSFG